MSNRPNRPKREFLGRLVGARCAVMMHVFDRHATRFAVWVGNGRDPEVAYLDARQLVIMGSELTMRGLVLERAGRSFNVLGGECMGALDAAISHRIGHAVLDGTGERTFLLDEPTCAERDGLCDVAEPDPVPPLPYHESGSFRLDGAFALQWVRWDDPLRAGDLRRAVYLDGRHLLEAASGADGRPRVWPARGLSSHRLELVAPSATEAAAIEDRIADVTRSWPGPISQG